MENTKDQRNNSPTPILLSEFPYYSVGQTLQILDCSEFFLRQLVKKKILHKYYLRTDEKKEGKGRIYYKKEEIANIPFAKKV